MHGTTACILKLILYGENTMIKKIAAILFTGMLLVGLCACSSNNNKNLNAEYTEFPFVEMTEDGMFNAEEKITWREALKMFERNYKAIYDQTEEKLDAYVVRGEFMDYMAKSYNTAEAVAAVREPVKYTDISGHMYEEAINKMSSAGIISETEDGKFYPDGHMTRIEVVLFLSAVDNRSLEWRNTGESFKDVPESDPYYKVIMNALCGK